jgi:cell wall-associated NlpC family hydrolase
MNLNLPLKAILIAGMVAAGPAFAGPEAEGTTTEAVPSSEASDARESGLAKVISSGLALVGIRYRRGGTDAESGFDCSGFVGHVYNEAVGLVLPRTSKEISREGEPVKKTELEPGDLVFFNTLKRAFSHVGIYLGDNRFVHAPRPGRSVRVENITEPYWAKRYNGARRVAR